MTTAGYGLFFDNPSKGYIDFGKTTNSTLEAAFETAAAIDPAFDLSRALGIHLTRGVFGGCSVPESA